MMTHVRTKTPQNNRPEMLTTRRNLAVLALCALLVIGAVLAYFASDYLVSPEVMAIRLKAFGMWAPIAVVGLMILHCFVPFPAELVALCAGAVFGLVYGTLLIWIGAMLGAVLSFWLSRVVGQVVLKRWLPVQQHETLDRWTKTQGTVALLVSRLIPVIAFNLINYAAGLTKVRLWTFIWTTGIGILPITVLSVYLGSQMRDLSWSAVLTVSAIGLLTILLLHKMAKRFGWVER
jgi:uncharacterized membrane protein YdjX (TVP38/TMEM64 family)